VTHQVFQLSLIRLSPRGPNSSASSSNPSQVAAGTAGSKRGKDTGARYSAPRGWRTQRCERARPNRGKPWRGRGIAANSVGDRFSGLRWESIEEVSESNASKAATERAAAPAEVEAFDLSAYAEHPLVKLLRRTRLPRHPDPTASAREEAEFLLQAASEVEHQFIVEYLYALFSLDFDAGREIVARSENHLRSFITQNLHQQMHPPLDVNTPYHNLCSEDCGTSPAAFLILSFLPKTA
jgi:hypothetical protein